MSEQLAVRRRVQGTAVRGEGGETFDAEIEVPDAADMEAVRAAVEQAIGFGTTVVTVDSVRKVINADFTLPGTTKRAKRQAFPGAPYKRRRGG